LRLCLLTHENIPHNGLEEDIAAAETSLGEVMTEIPKVDFIFGLHVLGSELIHAF